MIGFKSREHKVGGFFSVLSEAFLCTTLHRSIAPLLQYSMFLLNGYSGSKEWVASHFMKLRRRDIEIFSLSFLDCICCGFGAIILLFVLSKFASQ